MIPGSTATSSILHAMPSFPIELADRCVKCGLCLPHCPTYQVEPVESESPRGRIALMQGLADGSLNASENLVRHLNQCLGCRACETVCPADVPYGQLIDAARGELRLRGIRPRMSWRIIAWVVSRKTRLRMAFALLRVALALRLDRILCHLTRPGRPLARYLALLPRHVTPGRFASEYPCPQGPPKGVVSLFLGCMGPALETDTLHAAIRVLNRMGYNVTIPKTQTCCGAIHQHAGYAEDANDFAQANVKAFDSENPIVVASTGCLATLREYPLAMQAGHREQQDAQSFSQRCVDLTRFVESAGTNKTHADSMALHTPCTQRLDPHDQSAAQRVADILAGQRCDTFGDGQCCGAAGTYMVDEPTVSRKLAKHLFLPDADVLMTSNIGCRLQIEALCRERGIDARVLHPVSMLDADDAAP